MAIDVEVCIVWCFCKASFRDMEWCYGFGITDVNLIRRDADVWSILFVKLVNGACFVANVGVVVEPEGSEFWEERPGDV